MFFPLARKEESIANYVEVTFVNELLTATGLMIAERKKQIKRIWYFYILLTVRHVIILG